MRTKIFVISLSGEPRREQFRRSVDSDICLSWSFFDAHRSLIGDAAYDRAKAEVRTGRPLTRSELGCFSSHRATWAWLCRSDFDQMLVMEDDVVADWSFLAMLCAQDLHALGIDYLKLFAKIPPRAWKAVATPFLDPYYHLIQITSGALGTQGYMLTRDGARMLLHATRTIDAPVDALLDRFWQTRLPILAVHPAPLFERYRISSIGNERFGASDRSAFAALRRFGCRLSDRAHRELAARMPLPASLRAVRAATQSSAMAPPRRAPDDAASFANPPATYSKQRAAQDHVGDGEIDHQAGDIHQRCHERR